MDGMRKDIRNLWSVLAATACFAATGAASASQPSARIGVPQDWSNRHVVYANPDTPDQAARKGQTAQWLRKARDPRFVAAVMRKLQPESGGANDLAMLGKSMRPATDARGLHRDWNTPLGANGVGMPDVYPAKYSFDINATASCANDFVVFPTATAGSAAQPTIVAYNNVYKTTCTGTVPRVFWSYDTSNQSGSGGSPGTVKTSPVLSYFDGGQQVAFVQTRSNNSHAQLVLLKWSSTAPGTVSAPTIPTQVTTALYRACAAPCMTVIDFATGAANPTDDSFSSPYVDYVGDVLWVGGNDGTLHKFSGIFAGTPAQVTAGGFPATVSTGNALSSPVFDGNTGQVFVGSTSGAGATNGGMLHRVDSTTGVVVNSAKLAIDSSTGVRTSPILDSGAARVYAFVYNDGTPGDVVHCAVVGGNNDGCRAITQFTTSFAGASAGVKARLGRGNSLVNSLYSGTFDDAYYSSSDFTGAIYVVGGDPVDTFVATLWKIPITANVMGSPVQGAAVGSKDNSLTSTPSPMSEVKNGTHDYLYFSLPTNGIATGCAGACVYVFDLSNLPGTVWGTGNTARAGLAVPGGSSGIIIDNTSNATGASQVYFSNLATPGKAYQASQALLN